jgi:hypothetical protein
MRGGIGIKSHRFIGLPFRANELGELLVKRTDVWMVERLVTLYNAGT